MAENINERYDNLLSDKRERITRLIINIILVMVIMAIFGCFDFINWGFSFEKFITGEYWTHLMSRVGSSIAAFNIGINLNWENAIKKSVELKEQISLYTILRKEKDDSNFGYFVNHVFNPKLKRRAYINKINRKIHRLDKFSKDRDRKLYDTVIPVSEPNYEQLKKELDDTRAKNKYCIRRAELEYLKSDEYIKRNIDSIGVKYSRVKASTFDVDIDSKIREDKFETEGNIAFGKFKASTGVASSIILVSMVLNLISYSLNQEQFIDQMQAFWYFFLNCLIDVGLILWRIFGGIRTSPKIVGEQLTVPYANRNKTLKDYIEWKITSQIKPSESFVKIQDLKNQADDTVEVEITPDQLKEIIQQKTT